MDSHKATGTKHTRLHSSFVLPVQYIHKHTLYVLNQVIYLTATYVYQLSGSLKGFHSEGVKTVLKHGFSFLQKCCSYSITLTLISYTTKLHS